MGKEYMSELRVMAETYTWSRTVRTPALAKFTKKSKNIPLIAVGSGGSVTAAEIASMLHPAVSCTMTTEAFLECTVPNNCAVLLCSAGGNNNDILAAYAKAVNSKPKVIGIVCANSSSRLVKTASVNQKVMTHAVTPPLTGMDGFLATNTLLATAVWLMRAYEHDIPTLLHDIAYGGIPSTVYSAKVADDLTKFKGVSNMLILYDLYGKPAAVDVESKMHEAGIMSVQLADYRNFAHGRHNWLDKHPETLVVALVTPKCSRLANATLGMIPEHINRYVIHTDTNNYTASISLMISMFYVVGFFGHMHGIDPGRPTPPKFARSLYKMDVSEYLDTGFKKDL